MDTIKRTRDGTIYYSIATDHAITLKRYKPKGCPFNDYSFYDLLTDFISSYYWRLPFNKEVPLFDFVKMLIDIGYAHAVAYGQFIYDILYEGEYDD